MTHWLTDIELNSLPPRRQGAATAGRGINPAALAFMAALCLLTPSMGFSQDLADVFTPKPGTPLTLQDWNADDFARPITFASQGIIKVHPRKGSCVMISPSPDETDIKICKETFLKWSLKDLDIKGRILWQIQLNKTAAPLDVYWPTPYRIGKSVPLSMPWPGQTKPIGILACEKSSQFRRIRLTLLENEIWTIGFPDTDTLTPQPPKMLNLPIYHGNTNAGFIKIAKQGGESEAEKEEAKKEGEEHKEGKSGDVAAEGSDDEEDDIEEKAREKIVTDWQIHPRNSHSMDGSYFFQVSPVPVQARMNHSECRYKYAWDSDPSIGVIECHDAGSLRWVILPLTCLDQIKPK